MNAVRMQMFSAGGTQSVASVASGFVSGVTSIAAPSVTPATSDIYGELDRYMRFIVPDCNSRILGQQNLHFSILDVVSYWMDPKTPSTWGSYTVETVVNRTGRYIGPWYAIKVNNIMMGSGFPVALYFWGEVPGINTVVTRVRWWQLYFISSIAVF